jgi:hypothetical protein
MMAENRKTLPPARKLASAAAASWQAGPHAEDRKNGYEKN